MKHQKIRIVLIETSHPGNIGAVARAMKNMCIEALYLVKPREYPSVVATARASGADDVLAKAVVCNDLEEAIADCQLVVGASARLRSINWPELNPRQCATLIKNTPDSDSVAIIFGREDSGLTNAELDRCQYLVHIPTNKEYSSLNIAAAVQVICYELFTATNGISELPPAIASPLLDHDADAGVERASAKEMEGMFQHMEEVLTEIGFLKPPSCQKLMRRLRRMYNRAGLDSTDINILRGVMSAAEGRKYEWKARNKKNDSEA
ncbi:MAG: RNA methyltransferase [Gammaproteobacteria bacterium]|nr:RNA methyltransferase [Gammaproteobacteria bacterium]